MVEGAKATGKTFLIEQAAEWLDAKSWKFPYVDYFNEFLKKTPDDTGSNSREAHHFARGYDITMLSMFKECPERFKGLLVDRGFLSNIVLSLMQDRSTQEEEHQYIDYLHQHGLLKNIKIIYINRDAVAPERNKDEWEYLDYTRQDELYREYIEYMRKNEYVDFGNIHMIKNTFDESGKNQFIQLVKSLR